MFAFTDSHITVEEFEAKKADVGDLIEDLPEDLRAFVEAVSGTTKGDKRRSDVPALAPNAKGETPDYSSSGQKSALEALFELQDDDLFAECGDQEQHFRERFEDANGWGLTAEAKLIAAAYVAALRSSKSTRTMSIALCAANNRFDAVLKIEKRELRCADFMLCTIGFD